jgi:hypothetical protein
MVPEPKILSCAEWGARPPKAAPAAAGRPVRAIFHHTAGHAPKNGTNLEAAKAYARAIQNHHMDGNGWNDSGHSFLVMRSGLILEGRRGTLARIRTGRMVVSAHCPGQNDQPGVEHEHVSGGEMTKAQFRATVALHAWMFDRCKIRPTEIFAHNDFFPTACPDNLENDLKALRLAVAQAMTPDEDAKARRLAVLRAWILARLAEGWSWQRIKASANWREFRKLGGK